MASADVSINIQVKASRFRQWLVIPLYWLLGERHPLVARIWDVLEPLRMKVEDHPWETVRWDDFLRWIEKEGK